MKRRTFLKNFGVAAVLPLLANVGCASTRPGAREKGTSLRVLSCNIRVDVREDTLSGDGWAQRRDFCADVIASREPDLIGFQEMQVAHFDYLRDRLRQFETFALYNPGKSPLPLNAIFFSRRRFQLLSSGGFWLSEAPHVAGSKSWDSDQPRFVNWVQLMDQATGRQLRFWNTHLDHRGHKARENGAAMIVEAGKPLPDDLPQLLTGDMNAGFDHPAIRNLQSGGWMDTYGGVHGPKDPGFTGHAFKGVNAPGTRADGSPKPRIDWIFYRGPLKPVEASVIRDSKNGKYPSDHFFMSAEVEYKA